MTSCKIGSYFIITYHNRLYIYIYIYIFDSGFRVPAPTPTPTPWYGPYPKARPCVQPRQLLRQACQAALPARQPSQRAEAGSKRNHQNTYINRWAPSSP